MTTTANDQHSANTESIGKRMMHAIGAENLSLIIALVLMVALIATQTEFFFSARNLFNIAQNMAVVGLIAVG
ncbi:MAG: hypothetical protein P8Q23_03105, partial [Paracoccaceae bacterium]|nr:hypothetical protein [Paracoccaceae bacterium]